MKGFDTLKVKSAVRQHNQFDLSRSHLTTMKFGEIVPLFAEELVPGDKFNIDGNYFSRMAPMKVPCYGKFQFKTVAGFVPYHQLSYDAEAWLAGKTTFEGQTPRQRHMQVLDLVEFIRNYCLDSAATATATSANTEWTYFNSNGTPVYTVFSTQGRYWIKILNSLGYPVPEGVDYRTSSDYQTYKLTKLSAYPLLAFFKLYNDYMSQSQRFNTSALSDLLLKIKNGINVTSKFDGSTGRVQYAGMKDMFDNLLLNYGNDYFTSAWQAPNNALGSGENIASAPVPASTPTGATVGSVNGDNILTQSVNSTTINLGQRSLDFLKRFDDWVRRNNYSGSRAVQQVYSRFGIKTDDYRTHYANIITTDSQPIQVGDIMSQAATSTAQLGDYAGKGIMNGGNNVHFESNDYGILIILGYFTVTPMNAYGFNRMVLRNSPLDYYNPEFDGIGADAISVGEFFENPLGTGTTRSNAVFGFTERYNAYRYGRDNITGDFRKFRADDMNAWHTGRLLGDIRESGNLVAQSSSVNTFAQSDTQYSRIFSITDNSVDTFYLVAQFNVKALRPMLNLNQVTNLGEGDTIVPRNGNVIS